MDDFKLDDGRSDIFKGDKDYFDRTMKVINMGSKDLKENLKQKALELGIDISVLKENTQDKQIVNEKNDVGIEK